LLRRVIVHPAREGSTGESLSFIIDPPLLVTTGAAVEHAVTDRKLARALEVGTVATFVAVSLALYANAPGLRPIWAPFGARSGREFMLTSGLAEVDERAMRTRDHAAALAQFALYPLWFRLGIMAARKRA
jgi:hypothetical protein